MSYMVIKKARKLSTIYYNDKINKTCSFLYNKEKSVNNIEAKKYNLSYLIWYLNPLNFYIFSSDY